MNYWDPVQREDYLAKRSALLSRAQDAVAVVSTAIEAIDPAPFFDAMRSMRSADQPLVFDLLELASHGVDPRDISQSGSIQWFTEAVRRILSGGPSEGVGTGEYSALELLAHLAQTRRPSWIEMSMRERIDLCPGNTDLATCRQSSARVGRKHL